MLHVDLEMATLYFLFLLFKVIKGVAFLLAVCFFNSFRRDKIKLSIFASVIKSFRLLLQETVLTIIVYLYKQSVLAK